MNTSIRAILRVGWEMECSPVDELRIIRVSPFCAGNSARTIWYGIEE